MARSTPFRISGSPPLRTSDANAVSSVPSLRESTILPVTSRPHAAALTNSDGDAPTCVDQSPLLILSRIRRSRVAASGMRSSASARHMSAMPSRLSSENSSISASTPPAFERSTRTACASVEPRACAAARSSGVRRASGTSARTCACLVAPACGGDAGAQRREIVVGRRGREGEIEAGGHGEGIVRRWEGPGPARRIDASGRKADSNLGRRSMRDPVVRA